MRSIAVSQNVDMVKGTRQLSSFRSIFRKKTFLINVHRSVIVRHRLSFIEERRRSLASGEE